MPLRRILAKLLESTLVKDVESCKTAIKEEMANLAKSQRDSRELHTAVQQVVDVYFTKKAEFIVDVVAVFPEGVANELLRQISEKLLFAHKEYAMYSSGVTFSASQSVKYYEILCVTLEFLLKVVSRGPWWNQLVIGAAWSAFSDIIRDRTLGALGCECYISVVYILSICVPYSIASLDERLMLWLCSIANTMLNRTLAENKATAQQMIEENMKSSIMQLVLILYGIIPITFIRQLMQNCPSDVVDFVVSQLRLHPILSQHLAQRAQQQQQQQQQQPAATSEVPASPTSPVASTASIIGGGGLSQAECKSKNRFRGKDFSDIVTECLNYEATSPPKMFSADFPAASLLASFEQTNQTLQGASVAEEEEDEEQQDDVIEREIDASEMANGEEKTNRWSTIDGSKVLRVTSGNTKGCHHHRPFVQHTFVPDWFHELPDRDSFYFYSCPASPSSPQPPPLAMKKRGQTQGQQPVSARTGPLELLQLSSDTLATPSKQYHRRSRVGDMKAQKSLAQVNDSIRSMLAIHRVSRSGLGPDQNQQGPPLSPTHVSPETSVPSHYVKCYVKLAHLKSDSLNETELLKEQLRLAQLSLTWERHRSLIFVCKNRSLMTEHKKNGEVEGHLEEAKRRIHELETKLEHEIERRNLAEQRIFTMITQSRSVASAAPPAAVEQPAGGGLSINVANPATSEFVRANLSPRPRLGPMPPLEPVAAVPPPSNEQVPTAAVPVASTGMHRAQSSTEFTTTTSNGSVAASSVAPLEPQPQPPSNAEAMKRELEELHKCRDDLQTELGVLRQQLRQVQLEALIGTGTGEEGIISMQIDGGNGAAGQNKASESSVDEITDRMELLAAQLSDSRREVASLGELMAEMKLRLDVAESDRRRLSAELTRIALYGTPSYGAATKMVPLQLALVGSSGGTAATSSSTTAQTPSTSQQQQQQNQYPTLKKQVEKILLKKQEIATTSSTS